MTSPVMKKFAADNELKNALYLLEKAKAVCPHKMPYNGDEFLWCCEYVLDMQILVRNARSQ